MSKSNLDRDILRLHDNWKFTRTDLPHAADPDFDDSAWESVTVPHDWAIAGPFARQNDIQESKLVKDGQTVVIQHTGRTGGLPHVGTAWYRRELSLPRNLRDRRVFIEFDGVMSNSTVFLNARPVGSWPYGYSSFCFELTDFIVAGGPNILAVRVENKPASARWYPGAGIYRNVRLVIVHPVHVAHWGVTVTTPEVSDANALVAVRTEILNQGPDEREVELITTLISPDGSEAASASWKGRVAHAATASQQLSVARPLLWSVDTPQLYTAVSSVLIDGRPVDSLRTPFGIRQLTFHPDKGMALNGRPVRLNGVCLHHDQGCLGAAVNRRAVQRQLEILKDMGCNAIRTSHNPPAPELLEFCDTMGFLVMDEAFDEWRIKKCDKGYHLLFDQWAEKDLRAMIRRDRNHPSVIMWSIGNEILEQKEAAGTAVARFLTDICHDEDPTRPVTAGLNFSDDAIKNGMADVLDLPGWNYKPGSYKRYHAEHPKWVMVASETESCVSSRGEYCFPVKEGGSLRRDVLHVSSYDAFTPIGYSADYEFEALDDNPCILGQFTWTGFDYLGEPTPYDQEWSSRSSYFGIVDLAGLPKDRYYLYRSRWAPEKPTLHISPHWNWEGRQGEITPVWCYSNCDAAELFLNGRSLGVKRKGGEWVPRRYRLIWDDVPYEPGTLKVVALDAAGRPVLTREMHTAGASARIELLPDRNRIISDGEDLSFVTVRVTDDKGNLCPHADHLIQFRVEGPGRIAGVDNGDQTSTESFVSDRCRAFHGLCIVVLRSQAALTGRITLRAVSDGLESASVQVETRKNPASRRKE